MDRKFGQLGELNADSSGRAVTDVGFWPSACWDRGFESHWGHGCLSLVRFLYCQVEVSATDLSLVQRSTIECGVSECDLETSKRRPPGPLLGCSATGNERKGVTFKQLEDRLHVTH
jgi:hypothetical protein